MNAKPTSLIPLETGSFPGWLEAQADAALVIFTAPWCVACRMLYPTLEAVAAAEPQRRWVGKIDADASPELAERFGVTALPTMVLFRAGAPVASLVGAVSRPALDQWLSQSSPIRA